MTRIETKNLDQSSKNSSLEARLEALEQERIEQFERTNEAIAAAQDRAYWLDRWHLDLNKMMQRPGAKEFRTLLRTVRLILRYLRRGYIVLQKLEKTK